MAVRLSEASLRCVGLGECRKHDTGIDVPELHGDARGTAQHTRPRAHAVRDASGRGRADGWHDEHVKQTLDLCLSCKACKSECPANVDMATYRAEFLSHYYEGSRRPIHAYAFGLIDRWLRLGSAAPAIANALVNAPGVTQAVKHILQVAPERRLPRIARTTFRQWVARHGVRTVGRTHPGATSRRDGQRTDVILWIDTFNNYFHPETSQAAFEVLESAGYTVTVPQRRLCCGRPLYDFGLLDRAKRYLQVILDESSPAIDAGTPIVVLEPSCASVFRDELRNLFPHDPRASRLSSQTLLLI